VVSHPEVVKRLRQLVCIRLDHDQMQKHKSRLKVPTQGNQVLLTPRGEYVLGTDPRGKRYDVKDFVSLLDRTLRDYPPHPERKDDLKLAWFWWNPRDQRLPGHFGADAIARLDRKLVLTASGPLPEWLDQPDFLRRHLRQLIWARAARDGPARLTVRMLEPQEKELLALDPTQTTPVELSKALDRAWLQYMKERPLTARGYIDNAHGGWLKQVMERAHEEELRVRDEARKGSLTPPGRDDPLTRPVGRLVYYSGRVQGVGFRATAVEIARTHLVTGWVKNLSDGRVQLLATGSPAEVSRFLDAILARWRKNIEEVETGELRSPAEHRDFRIVR
jgi:acylphosphatase